VHITDNNAAFSENTAVLNWLNAEC